MEPIVSLVDFGMAGGCFSGFLSSLPYLLDETNLLEDIMDSRVNPANIISILRVVLSGGAVLSLVQMRAHGWAMSLIAASVILDAVDGKVARVLGCESKLGDTLDRAADYIVASMMWITLSAMGLVSLWVPIITTARDFLVLQKGVLSRQGKFQWLASSRAMRAGYGILKLASWELAIWSIFVPVSSLLDVVVWTTVGVCLLRALPVLMQSRRNNSR